MCHARNRRSVDALFICRCPCGVVDPGVGVSGLPGFTVCVDFLGDRVALLVRGDVDLFTVNDLEAVLAAVVREDPRLPPR